MKPFFFLLLFINIVYFLWQYQRETLENKSGNLNQLALQIQLLKEVPQPNLNLRSEQKNGKVNK